MLKGSLTFAEKFLYMMVWVVLLLIVAYAIFGYAENKGGSSPIGKVATWFNDRLRPQAS